MENPQARDPLGIEGAALRDRNLGDAPPGADGLDDHLARALHPRTSKRKRARRLDTEPAQAAMEIAERRAGKQFADARQQGIADAAPQKRHRLGVDSPGEAVAEHKIMSLAQPVPKGVERIQIVLPVAVSENGVPTRRRLDARNDGVAVSRSRLVNDACPGRAREGRRTVAAAIVYDHDLAGDIPAFQEAESLADTMRDGLLLVAAENEYRQFKRARAGPRFAHCQPV